MSESLRIVVMGLLCGQSRCAKDQGGPRACLADLVACRRSWSCGTRAAADAVLLEGNARMMHDRDLP
jgi:hypothetical protein